MERQHAPRHALVVVPGRPAIIEYRNPLTVARHARVVQLLREREAMFWVKLSLMMLAGVPFCFLGPALVAQLVWHVQARARVHEPLNWWLPFIVSAGLIIPLLFRLERRTRGKFFEEAARDAGLGDNAGEFGPLRTASRGEWEMQTTLATWTAIVEILLLGPRMLISAQRQWRMRRHLGEIRYDRAARIVHLLLDHDHGVTIDILLRGGQTRSALWPSLLLLAFHNCIGISKDATRVWLSSDVRQQLTA